MFVVAIFAIESLIQSLQGRDPSVGVDNFWEDFFLLRVNAHALEEVLTELSEPELLKQKVNIVVFCTIINGPI